MPDAGDAPDRLPSGAADTNPDRVGEELADDAHIWRVYDRVAKEDDDRRISSWNRGLDNLALFAGLFSAVTTAFIIEAQADMKPDYSQLIFQSLNASTFNQRFVPEPFVVPSGARTVNSLWVSSLVLSLSAALIAIMGKDWIGMYASRPVCNPRQWAEMRTYRLRCAEQWYLSGVIAAAPVLLHVSLLLFGAGLVVFISADSLVHYLALALCLSAGALYVVTALSAVVFSASPFKSPATQMIRATIPEFILYLRISFSPPKRNVLTSLQRAINDVVAPGLCPAESQQCRSLRASIAARFRDASLPGNGLRRPWSLSSPLRSFRCAVASSAHSLSLLPRLVTNEYHFRRQRPRRRPYWFPVLSWYRDLRIGDVFFGCTWTESSLERRPTLLAESLSWLDSASQAPGVLRALVFALGDLEIGEQVAHLVSSELCSRVRADIRHRWTKADFVTLSRYVLADRNLPHGPVIHGKQFLARCHSDPGSAVRCEHGLAACISIEPHHDLDSALERCCPDHVTQPRMLKLLLPRIAQRGSRSVGCLIIIANAYWPALLGDDSFSLEAEIWKLCTPRERRRRYDRPAIYYDGQWGPVELLTFIIAEGGPMLRAARAAQLAGVDLIFQILESPHRFPHPCLSLLSGSLIGLQHAPWGNKVWTDEQMALLSWSLHYGICTSDWRYSATSIRDRRAVALDLAYTAVLLLSPFHSIDFTPHLQFLYDQLCSPSSLLGDLGKTLIFARVLETSALIRILLSEIHLSDFLLAERAVAILATAARRLARQMTGGPLAGHVQRRFGRFGQFAFRTVQRGTSGIATWDLGRWLKDVAPGFFTRFPSARGPMEDFHEAMISIYPLCEHHAELRRHWERIDYPGRPGDIFSDPFLDVGQFFAAAESRSTAPA